MDVPRGVPFGISLQNCLSLPRFAIVRNLERYRYKGAIKDGRTMELLRETAIISARAFQDLR